MEMTPRERVLCALGRGEPDRVPYCEANIDPMVATKLLGLEVPKELSVGSVYARSVEEEKALSRLSSYPSYYRNLRLSYTTNENDVSGQ